MTNDERNKILSKMRRDSLRSFKISTFLSGWLACSAFYAFLSLIQGEGNVWLVFGFAMCAAASMYEWRQAFGDKTQEKVQVVLRDKDGKEIQ